MPTYYVNTNAQDNGDHEVHESSCAWLPAAQNQLRLGDFPTCHGAVRKAKEYYTLADGCAYCCPDCHTR